VQRLMNNACNIRNVSFIGYVNDDHSHLADVLASQRGITITAENQAAEPPNEGDGAPIKSPAIPLCFEASKEICDVIKQQSQVVSNRFLINLVNPAQHGEPSSEISAALRTTDGAVFVIDCVEGISLQTEDALRQASADGVKPVLAISEVDRALLELQPDKESLYQVFRQIIESCNNTISLYGDTSLGDVRVHPSQDTVAFASALQGWTFTLRQFVTTYAAKFGVDKKKMMDKLWGDNYFDPRTKKWTTYGVTDDGTKLERGFNAFVLAPIYKIVDAAMNSKRHEMLALVSKLDIKLSQDEEQLEGGPLFKAIMSKFLPTSDVLLEMITVALPSPVTAQRYRVRDLYEGPMSDEAASGIRDCDPAAPLVLYVSKLVPSSDKGRFYAFGRIFSGRVTPGLRVRIQGPNYIPYQRSDLFVKPVQRTLFMATHSAEPMESVPAGNIIGLAGIDQFILKNGTLTTSETAHNIKPLRFSVAPIVQVAVEVRNAGDLPKLVDGLKSLSKSEPGVQTWVSESGEHIIASASELRLDICFKDLQEDHAGVALKRGRPIVTYRETVKAESSMIAISKSPNKRHRIHVTACPLGEALTRDIEAGKINSRDESRTRARILESMHGWNIADAKRIWCFGPDTTGPNLLVDNTEGVQYVNEIKDACAGAFQWTTKEGVCAEESMRGVRFNILDGGSDIFFVKMQRDNVLRGNGQVIPMLRRVCYAAFLLATPGLQEPIYLVIIQCPENAIVGVHSALSQRRGQIISRELRPRTSELTMKAFLPVSESFGFTASLRDKTEGQALHQFVFDHYETMDSSPLDEGSNVEKIVTEIRMRKGLNPSIPTLDRYYDKCVTILLLPHVPNFHIVRM
ncbi:eukaryotic translation elongation factor 2, partial [Clavulina sp. PMI_390]